MENKFFAVTAKCGHVGRHQYYEGKFFVRALTASEAARIVRFMPRVKKHHRDAILHVRQVSHEEYLIGAEEYRNNPYFKCESKWQQRQVLEQIKPHLRPETDLQNERRFVENRTDKFPSYIRPKYKKPYKRERFLWYDYLEEQNG